MTDAAHLQTDEAKAARIAARQANRSSTRRTTKPGSETTNLTPGTPIRIHRTGVSSAYAGRSGWVAVVNTQRFDNGLPPYTGVGVTFVIAKDWERAAADAWFRTDELREATA